MATLLMLGAGMMGSALCVPLADRGHRVRLVGTHLDREIVEALKTSGVHPKLGLPLPDGIEYFQMEELGQALSGADAVLLGVSSAGVEWAAHTLAPFLSEGFPILMVAKGLRLHEGALVTLPDAFTRSLPETLAKTLAPAAVAGPCIAGELARRVETCVVLTSRDEEALGYWKRVARGPYYHVFTSTDLVGAEVCAALKNAYAMGIALGAGLHEARGGQSGSVAHHNYESAVFAQSVLEMSRLVELAGGQRESAFGLPGVGDLDVTCNGGRTGRFGRFLGQGLGRNGAIEKMEGATLECLEILEVMRRALPQLEGQETLQHAELPLLRELMRIALDGAPVALPFEKFFGSGVGS
jgi:glycerol-3-phosphate dehydrogenase (NAD(P)+)